MFNHTLTHTYLSTGGLSEILTMRGEVGGSGGGGMGGKWGGIGGIGGGWRGNGGGMGEWGNLPVLGLLLARHMPASDPHLIGAHPSCLSPGATPLSRRTRVIHPTGGLSPIDEAELGRPPCARNPSTSHRRCARTRDSLHQTG